MAKKDPDGLSQRSEDAIVNLLASKMVDKQARDGRSLLKVFMDETPAAKRKLVEDSLDRHAARQRKAGKPGW